MFPCEYLIIFPSIIASNTPGKTLAVCCSMICAIPFLSSPHTKVISFVPPYCVKSFRRSFTVDSSAPFTISCKDFVVLLNFCVYMSKTMYVFLPLLEKTMPSKPSAISFCCVALSFIMFSGLLVYLLISCTSASNGLFIAKYTDNVRLPCCCAYSILSVNQNPPPVFIYSCLNVSKSASVE